MNILPSLAGQYAIVTGGARGIGLGICRRLEAAGARVAVWDRDLAPLAANFYAPAFARQVDVTSATDVEAAFAETAALGQVHILVNNAGRGMKYVSASFMTEPTPFWMIEPQTWRMVIDTNVNGPFLMARSAVPAMLKAGWGRIVNVSMNHETMRRRGFSPYGPSKAALESETIIWAQELAGTGVTVNALLPGGATLTGMIPDGVPDEVRSALLDPAIVLPPLLWLASSESDEVTGRRLVATRWRTDREAREAAEAAMEDAGWALH